MLEKGLVQIYTGDGKGKTTAALGLALRAAGRGNSVLIYQFLKPPSAETGERIALKDAPFNIAAEALPISWDMAKSRDDQAAVAATRTAIRNALDRLAASARQKEYDILILDEIVFCLVEGLAQLKDIKTLINARDPRVEIVMTGRAATKELIVLADLVTEMKNVKHPFDKGIAARRGIEY
ncbi:MAG: cob(I)yrinic acid a,c-diamide adenosyltransferase [Sedimentisphaerales bacterium]|nr:cob(I)yrinic acid a,c-diamide adenosyltransferase [Sedimentisphaerales bacterium]